MKSNETSVRIPTADPRGDSSAIDAARNRLQSGRNGPCPCGSGRKYKKCCLRDDEAVVRQGQTIRRAESSPASQNVTGDEEMKDVPRKIESQQDQLWGAFDALSQPTIEQMDEFLANLLALPPEDTDWSDLLHEFARHNYPDLHAVFRRIADAVPHTKETGMGFFYWAAAEEFARNNLSALLPEAAAGFRKLDQDSYDADALSHIMDYLLAGYFEGEALELAEYFLPIMSTDGGLMPYAVPDKCNLIFELRVGIAMRSEPGASASPETLAQTLRRGIEEEIHVDAARNAAGIVCDQAPCPWTRTHFELVTGDLRESDVAWQECLRLYGTLMQVAREAWRIENVAPGCAFRGLSLLLDSLYNTRADKRARSKKEPKRRNLLDGLSPSGIEGRIAWTCRDIIGVNEPRARLLLEAHGILLRFGARHQLIAEGDAASTQAELARLHRLLAQ